MFSDLKFIIFWWLIIFLLGTISLPLIFALFKKFWDKGYIFSKIISISLITYLIFILGVIKLLPFTNLSLFIIILFLILINVFYFIKFKKLAEFLEVIKSKYKVFIFQELLFLVILVSWSLVRGFNPDIEGLEKFMDWGFINSALRSTYMPPIDMWFSGSPINYYYFGHLIFAVLTKLSSITSAITYNLSIATVCALTFVSAFSLSSNLVYIFSKKTSKLKTIIFCGLISALLLTFGGNLHPLYKAITKPEPLPKFVSTYWYPDATRFIGFDPDTQDKTIHEFPSYSFVVADLHGHMNDIPVILFFCAMIFSLSLSIFKKIFNWKLIISSGLVLSIAYMTNAWDFAIYGILFAIFIFISNLSKTNFLEAFNKTVLNGLLVIIFWYLFSLPFSLNFTPMAQGLRFSDVHTPFYQLSILYGGFWLICLPFLLYLIYSIVKKLKIKNSDFFVLSLIVTATILVIIPEIFYIKDIYINEYRRANTMFKLVYEAFIMYSISAGYILFRLTRSKNLIFPNLYKLIFFLIFIVHMSYPYFSIKSFYTFKSYKGLWGLNYLKESYPDNLKAINWINQNIKGQPVMLEATGDSYTTFNQISVATGLPTIEGWLVHEWLWRGGYDKPGARQEEVKKVYEDENLDEVKTILQKHKVEYIFVGAKEHEKYPNLDDKRFQKIGGEIIFQSSNTKIYKI
ncbi:MAG: DUF2298 domain-containing protein [Candidatus Shapirobacteria bacterium]